MPESRLMAAARAYKQAREEDEVAQWNREEREREEALAALRLAEEELKEAAYEAEFPDDPTDPPALETLECVESDGRMATHLHGGRMGLEPCCGQHEDCDEQEDAEE